MPKPADAPEPFRIACAARATSQPPDFFDGAMPLTYVLIRILNGPQSGRWKSSRMPMRYGEEILAARGGIARAAAQQGRDSQ